jgi:hypothetical protein
MRGTRQSTSEARAAIHAAVEGLAIAANVPFWNTDEVGASDAPDGAIGVIFPGSGRAVVCYVDGTGYHSFWNGSGQVPEVISMCRFAVEIVKYIQKEG